MKAEVLDKFSALITAAFGLVAALAWNGAIKAVFDKYYAAGEGIGAMIWYAVIVTIIAVLATLWIGRAADKAKNVSIRKKKKK